MNSLTIQDLGLTETNLIRKIGDYGVYFRDSIQNIFLETEIFRYMKLDYFCSLVDEGILYIPNRNKFTDLRDRLGLEKYIAKHPFDFEFSAIPSYRERGWRKSLEKENKKVMDVCISCWTTDMLLNGVVDESFLMWKSYANTELACRIKTSIKHLINSITELSCDIVVSGVEYSNDNNKTYNDLLFKKTCYYESEHEVRFVALTSGKDHVDIKINPDSLNLSIKTSPFLTPIMESMVINGLKRKFPLLKNVIEPSKVMEYPYTNLIKNK